MGIQIVSYRCNVKNRMGKLISSSIVRDVILDPKDTNMPLKTLAQKLHGIKKGEARNILLKAHEAYGLYDPDLVVTRGVDDFDLYAPFKLGERIIVVREGVKTQMRVVELSKEKVTLDGNHPLAGQDLVFEIQAIDARDATPEDLHTEPPSTHRLLH